MNIEKRMDELISIINKASYEYYVLDNPTITDQEYDDAYTELQRLEKKYPELKREDSPTNRVGGEAIDDIIKRAFNFRRKGNKLYIYTKEEKKNG